jgi:hypothetical protein
MTEPPQQPDQPDLPEPPETPEATVQFDQEPPAPLDQEPPAPPRKSNAGVITAIVVGAALVLGGAGAGVYFLTKNDEPANTATGSSQTQSATQPSPTTPTSEVTGVPPTQNSDKAPPIQVTTTTPTPKPPEGGGGGGGGNGADDANIVQVAQKYAKAVTAKDEAAAKSATCDNETGLLYTYAQKVEVTGKPEKYGDDNANIFVRITVEGTDPIDDFPLFMDKKNNAWCISS